jgi:AraC family transcriptional regulator of adaptative response / DNA-3-methyladenine glycosylase II
LRLIRDGALSDDGVDDLGERVGVGARHLRRLFLRHVGATPIAVAQTQRTLFAKQLLDETNLPMTGIALAAGFASVRRFNAAMRSVYGRPPSQLRRVRNVPDNHSGLRIALAYRPPYDWASIAAYLGVRGTPGVEAANPTSYRRTLRLGNRAAWMEIAPHPKSHRLVVHLHADAPADSLLPLVGRVRQLFDLDADPDAIASHLQTDARLAPIIAARPGLRVAGAWDGFELAVRAILGQQVSVRAATTLIGRVATEFGEPLPASLQAPAELQRFFPLPRVLARAPLERCGITRARAAAIRALAAAIAGGELALDGSRGSEAEALEQLPGVGPWTAAYVALRALREPDAFPVTDLGLRRAFAQLAESSPQPASASTLARAAEAWRPWRGYAALHLWTWESRDVTHAV